MPKTAYQCYDHRLKTLVQKSCTIPELEFEIPISTIHSWKKQRALVTHKSFSLSEAELVNKLCVAEKKVKSLNAKLEFVLKVIEFMEWSIAFERFPDGKEKKRNSISSQQV